MSVVFEHVKVGDLPEAWRKELAKPADAHVTVRIDDEPANQDSEPRRAPASDEDPAFGIWRDREDMADVAACLRKIRASRYQRAGIRNDG